MFRIRDAVGLQPAQVTVATTLTAATAEVLGSADLLLCSAKQAEDLGLHWRPVGEIHLAAASRCQPPSGTTRSAFRTRLWQEIARCLGARDPARTRARR